MLSYKEFLLEGILRVDKNLLDFLESTFFVCLYNDKKDSLLAEQMFLFNQLEKKYKLIHDSFIEKNKVVYSGNQYLNIPYDHNGFQGNFNFVVDKKSQSLTGAEFHHGNVNVGINNMKGTSITVNFHFVVIVFPIRTKPVNEEIKKTWVILNDFVCVFSEQSKSSLDARKKFITETKLHIRVREITFTILFNSFTNFIGVHHVKSPYHVEVNTLYQYEL
jgi:hypothetical protein